MLGHTKTLGKLCINVEFSERWLGLDKYKIKWVQQLGLRCPIMLAIVAYEGGGGTKKIFVPSVTPITTKNNKMFGL